MNYIANECKYPDMSVSIFIKNSSGKLYINVLFHLKPDLCTLLCHKIMIIISITSDFLYIICKHCFWSEA